MQKRLKNTGLVYDISDNLGGLNLAHAWSHTLFEAWLGSAWFELDLLGDVKIFLASCNPV